jgi:ABC-type uncharacterized transport system involved in gliding motility auxiliary subunit
LAGLVALLAILVAANIILSKVRVRADLTGEKLYTLSNGSKAILKKLDQDVTLKLFFSSSLPEVPAYLKNYAKEVEDLLQEYAIASGGRITIEKYDPKPDSDAEEWAQRYGISGQPIDMFGSPVYFGLVAVMGSSEGVLPSLDPQTEQLLEYNITRLIYRIAHPEKPIVGVLSSLPVMGQRAPPFAMPGQPRQPSSAPWLVFQDIGGDYELREVPASVEKIDDDIKTLIIVHPKDLPEKTLYAIDQFVLRGGRVLAFLDPLCIADMEASGPSPFGMPRMASDLKPLLAAWGVTYEPDKVVADQRSASRIRVAEDRAEDSPVWLTLSSKNVSQKDILTSQLESLMLPFSGALSAESSKELTVTPLIMSSESSCSVNSMTAQFGGQALRANFKSCGVPLNLAIRLNGKFKTAFPNGKPKETPEGEQKAPESEPKSEGPGLQEGESAVILVADVDMIFDRFCVQELNFLGARAQQPLNDNLSFFANALEQVAGATDLVGIRSRGRFSRPFDKVAALQAKAMAVWQEKEKDLEEELKQTQEQLREMQAGKDKTQRFILSEKQKEAIAAFREKEIEIKKDLKDVRKNLRSDIERLGVGVKFINIALMPLLVCITGIGFWLYRRNIKASNKRGMEP